MVSVKIKDAYRNSSAVGVPGWRRLVKEVRTFVDDPANRVDLDAMKKLLEGRVQPQESQAA